MKLRHLALALIAAFTLTSFGRAEEPSPKREDPAPGGRAGSSSHESAEMQALVKSFNLTPEQQAKYDAARAGTAKKMREIHEGKVNGTLAQEDVLKQALAAHKALNAAVKEILTPEQYAQWEPLRESDHHKTAEAHKTRDAAAKVQNPPRP